MNLPHFFTDRPIFAAVISIVLVIVGAISLYSLPIAQYPDVVPPTIVVRANYPGANPKVIAETVATPIEQEVNGVENMLYMSSQSTGDGAMTLTITFKLGTNLDDAQVQVQNRVAIAEPKLPEEVRRLGVVTTKRSSDLTMVVHLLSPDGRYDQLYVSNYAALQIKDVLARVEGVGEVIVFGARDYSMRVWLDPQQVASKNMTAGDVVRAIRAQNVQVAAGIIGQPPTAVGQNFQYTVNVLGRLADEQQFGDIIIKRGADGQVVRVRDVARVELGAADYSVNSYLGGKPAVAMVIFQRPGTNSVATSNLVRKTMAELKTRFPDGIDYSIVYDPTIFVRQSIEAVVHTLFEAVLLVVIVVLVFLQNWRASIIPLIAVPVSLIGTFAVMAALGFSLNTLTLFGLVLAIGIVVDDAIVVVENVERNIELGLAPREATLKAMDEVSGAVVAIAIVLTAVFVPVAFIPGISGQFYKQFAITIAAATIISAFNSLTLSPALAAILLQPHEARKDWFGRLWDALLGWFFRLFNRGFDASSRGYGAAVAKLIRVPVIVLVIYGGLLALTYVGFAKVPTGFIPTQDKGYLVAFGQLPDAASLERTDKVAQQITKIALGTEGVSNAVAFAGWSVLTGANQSNAVTVFLPLKPFDERTDPKLGGQALVGQIQAKMRAIQDAYVGVFPPPAVQGLGSVGGFKMMVQDRTGAGLQQLESSTNDLIGGARKNRQLTGVFTGFRPSVPQLFLDVDRVKAESQGVPLQDVWDTLQIYLGSLYVNDFNRFGRTYRVTAQADSQFRVQAKDIGALKTRNTRGEMVPLDTLLRISEITAPDRITRYNLYPAAEINGAPAPGVSSGQAVAIMEGLAAEKLPRSLGFEWTDLTFQEKLAGNVAVLVFPLAVLFVFLALAALYESWTLPLAVILIVPMVLLSAIWGVWLRGLDNNIFTQIGFVVLVGLACKNAILIVEFAKQTQDRGGDRYAAVTEAARLRLRPILMTSFAFIFGVVPLAIATGAGAEMSRAMGTSVFFGMLGVTFFGLFLTPVFYVVIRAFVERRRARETPMVTGGQHA